MSLTDRTWDQSQLTPLKLEIDVLQTKNSYVVNYGYF